jgi:hypothetical protein
VPSRERPEFSIVSSVSTPLAKSSVSFVTSVHAWMSRIPSASSGRRIQSAPSTPTATAAPARPGMSEVGR